MEALGDCLGLDVGFLGRWLRNEGRAVVPADCMVLIEHGVVVEVFGAVLGCQFPGYNLRVEVHTKEGGSDGFNFGRLDQILAIFVDSVLFARFAANI